MLPLLALAELNACMNFLAPRHPHISVCRIRTSHHAACVWPIAAAGRPEVPATSLQSYERQMRVPADAEQRLPKAIMCLCSTETTKLHSVSFS